MRSHSALLRSSPLLSSISAHALLTTCNAGTSTPANPSPLTSELSSSTPSSRPPTSTGSAISDVGTTIDDPAGGGVKNGSAASTGSAAMAGGDRVSMEEVEVTRVRTERGSSG